MADAFQFSRILPVGGHYEQCLKVDAGHSLGWRFGASQSLAFNVHSHPDDEIVYHVRNETGSDEGSFQSPRSGVYCVMWENNSQQPSDLEGILTPAR
jgi:hypothetical protein